MEAEEEEEEEKEDEKAPQLTSRRLRAAVNTHAAAADAHTPTRADGAMAGACAAGRTRLPRSLLLLATCGAAALAHTAAASPPRPYLVVPTSC